MSEPITLGVEEEFLVVDAHTGELVPLAPELLAACAEGDPELRIMGELNLCQVEIDTTVCDSLSQVSDELSSMRATASALAAEVGAGLLPTPSPCGRTRRSTSRSAGTPRWSTGTGSSPRST
jgi:carboxylate-amine ligase